MNTSAPKHTKGPSARLITLDDRALVSEEDLESLIGLRNQIRQLRRMYDKRAADIMGRILADADVEPGLHTAEVITKRKGSKQITRLVIH